MPIYLTNCNVSWLNPAIFHIVTIIVPFYEIFNCIELWHAFKRIQIGVEVILMFHVPFYMCS